MAISFVVLIVYYSAFMLPLTPIGASIHKNIPEKTVILDLQRHYSVEEAYSLMTREEAII